MKRSIRPLTLLSLLLGLFSVSLGAQVQLQSGPSVAPTNAAKQWVESVFNSMSEDERIGQLMMIRAHSDKGPEHTAKIEGLIKKYHVGGLCFFQGTPEKQVRLLNRYQALTKRIPLMVSMDAEWGLGMRFKSDGMSFPRQLLLGAIQDNRLIYDMGKEIARQLRRVGVHVNFAPVVDVNNNPNNPVINTRSFGEDRYNVAAKSYMYMHGLQDGDVMACAKHFPGHGDTDVDSHLDLPVISHDRHRLDSLEMMPFRVLAQHGVQSMMVAHLHVPIIDDRTNLPTTLSHNAVTNILKEEIGFEGLIFTDGLGMKGVNKYHENGEVEAKALVAGNDVLLLPQDVPAAFKVIKEYIAEGKLSWDQVNESVKKVLYSKYDLGITNFKPISSINLRSELESPNAHILKRRLIENGLTLVRNDDRLVPFERLDTLRIASLSIGSARKTALQYKLDKYAKVDHYQVGKEVSSSKGDYLFKKLKAKEAVVISLHDMSAYAKKDFGLTSSLKNFIKRLNRETKVILVVLGNPYCLKYFDDIDNVVVAYNEEKVTQEVVGEALFGAIPIKGRLPVTASGRSQFNDGISTPGLYRLGYDIPERVGIDSRKLLKIDTLMKEAVRKKGTPGGVVLVAKDGKIVFEKAYGYHTYAKKTKVSTDDLFDLASLTKIAASTLSVMKLHEQRKLDVYQPMSRYLPALKKTNKENLTIKEIMNHRSGLKGWFKFYEETLSSSKKKRPSSRFYKKKPSDDFNIEVTSSLYLKSGYDDLMFNQIYESDLRSNKNYKYSDLGFYLVADMVEEVTKLPIDEYVEEVFYKPLGLQTMTYNPLQKFSKSSILPTEEDKYFRRQTVHGHVHDMGCAMLGGVGGHAGLFSNARDLAVLMQMLLNGGYYGGEQFLNVETISDFTTRCGACTRRAIGFDMRELNDNKKLNLSDKASANTYGHLGFTGTCVWVDPEHNLIYILLSNRTYPSMNNWKFSKANYRPRIQSIVYDAME